MNIREINIDHIDAIKKLMVDIFSKEPWNDTWADEQLHLYVSELIDNKNSLSPLGYLEEDTFMGNALRQDPHFTVEVQNEQNNSMVFYLEQLHKEVL